MYTKTIHMYIYRYIDTTNDADYSLLLSYERRRLRCLIFDWIGSCEVRVLKD